MIPIRHAAEAAGVSSSDEKFFFLMLISITSELKMKYVMLKSIVKGRAIR